MKINEIRVPLIEGLELRNKDTRKEVFFNITAVNIALIIFIYVALFCMPDIIYASTAANTVYHPYEIVMAKRTMKNYHDVTLDLFTEEEPKINLEDLIPHPTYSYSDSNYYMYSGHYAKYSIPGNKAWSHAFSLRRRGLIYGADASYQCTFFAQMWFYDIYGYNSTGYGPSGNGEQFAMNVYLNSAYYDEEGNYKHYFELGNKPATMGIVSIYSSAQGGHVLCVDEVDYENNTITISEGNVTGIGDVRIRQTMSIDRFYALNPGYKVYANPTQELIEKVNADKNS